MRSARQTRAVWKSRAGSKLLLLLPWFSYWWKSQTCWQMFKNKEAMKESHYEPETKIRPVCALKVQQGQDTDDVSRPSYQMLNGTVKIVSLFVKTKNRAWNVQGFRLMIMKVWYWGKQSDGSPPFLAVGGNRLREKTISVHRASPDKNSWRKKNQLQAPYQLWLELDGLNPCTPCISWP